MVLCALELFVKAEAQAELALVSYRQVRENEVASGVRTVQIDHASNGCAGKDCGLVWVWHATRLCQMPGRLQGSKKEIVGVHHKSDVFGNLLASCASLEFKHLELDNWWRVNGPAIGGC